MMTLCAGCAVAFDNAALEVTDEGPCCPECAKKVVPGRPWLQTPTWVALAALALTFLVDVGWSSSTTVNGATETHAVALQQLVGGPLAALLGLGAAGSGLLSRRPADATLGGLVVLLGALQLLRGLLAL